MVVLTRVREELARQLGRTGDCGSVECENIYIQRLRQEDSKGASGQHEVVGKT